MRYEAFTDLDNDKGFFDHCKDQNVPMIEYWEEFHGQPAAIMYFAGGPSSCIWILPGQEY